MSKNAESNDLSASLSGIPEALTSACPDGAAVIVARVIDHFSEEAWKALENAGKLEGWQIIPLEGESIPGTEDNLPVSPFREAYGALEQATFSRLLTRELLRLERNGGCLSLVGATLFNTQVLECKLGTEWIRRLQALLGKIMLHEMSACDSLGILRRGEFICSLPGFGQLAARSFAEKCQTAFAREAGALLNPMGEAAACAMGIVNVMQGEHPALQSLLKRARSTIEVALSKQGRLIYQETSATPLENTTLVQSSEKRFLFFGEDPA